jgi:hypothetical protein
MLTSVPNSFTRRTNKNYIIHAPTLINVTAIISYFEKPLYNRQVKLFGKFEFFNAVDQFMQINIKNLYIDFDIHLYGQVQ